MALFITFAILVSLTSPVRAGGQPESEDITGVVWKWQQTRYNNRSTIGSGRVVTLYD
jgi:hypothetical protein